MGGQQLLALLCLSYYTVGAFNFNAGGFNQRSRLTGGLLSQCKIRRGRELFAQSDQESVLWLRDFTNTFDGECNIGVGVRWLSLSSPCLTVDHHPDLSPYD